MARPEPRGGGRRRFGVITVDQAVAGFSNVLVALMAARMLDVADFGLFVVTFLVYTVAQCVVRALVSDPLLLHAADAEGREGEVVGTGLLAGCVLAVVLAVAAGSAWALGMSLAAPLAVLAACLPLLVLQDLGRYLAFAMHRAERALLLDGAWLGLVVVGIAALTAAGSEGLTAFVAVWAVSGAAAGSLVLVHQRDIHLHAGWLRFTWAASWRYLLSYVATQGSALAIAAEVGTIAGGRALGGIQAGLLLIRPLMPVQVAAIAATVSSVARSMARGARLRRRVRRVTVVTAGIAAANAVALLVLPGDLGVVLLGDAWEVAEPLLLPIGVQAVGLGLVSGARAGLLGARATHDVMLLDVALGVAFVVAVAFGARLDGARGAAWACALVQLAITAATWAVFLRRTHADVAAAVVPASA